MNGYERISNVLKKEKVDMTPLMLHNFMPAATECGYTMGEFRKDPRKIANAFITATKKYELDGILVDIDTCMEAYAMGVNVDFPDDEPARVRGSAGSSFEEILDKVDPAKLHSDERIKVLLEATYLMKKDIDKEVLLRVNADQGPFSLAMLCYGMMDFMTDLLDEEANENILKLINRCYDVHLEYHKMLKGAGADITSFGDSSCGPDLINRECYLKFAQPFHKRLQQDLNKLGIDTICHICGNLDNIIEDVAEIGFIGIEVDYKTNIMRAQQILNGKSVMFGPIDPSGIFYFGKPEDVIRETKKVIQIFNGQNLVIGAGCALPRNTPEENIKAFVSAVRHYKTL